MSHAEFLREHWNGEQDSFFRLMRGVQQLGKNSAGVIPELTRQGALDLFASVQGLDAQDVAILDYVAWLTLTPSQMSKEQVQRLWDVGLGDRQVHDVAMVAACFAFMNRVADGLGVAVFQKERQEFAVELFGETVLDQHKQWA